MRVEGDAGNGQVIYSGSLLEGVAEDRGGEDEGKLNRRTGQLVAQRSR